MLLMFWTKNVWCHQSKEKYNYGFCIAFERIVSTSMKRQRYFQIPLLFFMRSGAFLLLKKASWRSTNQLFTKYFYFHFISGKNGCFYRLWHSVFDVTGCIIDLPPQTDGVLRDETAMFEKRIWEGGLSEIGLLRSININLQYLELATSVNSLSYLCIKLY